MSNEKILVIGACGQIGVELTLALRKVYGDSNVLATDIREEHELLVGSGPYMVLDAMDGHAITEVIKKTRHYPGIPAGGIAVGHRRESPQTCLGY